MDECFNCYTTEKVHFYTWDEYDPEQGKSIPTYIHICENCLATDQGGNN